MSVAASKISLRGWHVFAILVGFFLTVTVVDGILITKAVSTFSGDTADAYRKGLAYNQTLQEEADQNRLGWHENRTFDSKTGRLAIALADENRQPIEGLLVKAEIGRATTDIFDRRFDLVPTGNGTYTADISGLSEGTWTLSVTAAENDKVVYRSKERIWKQP
ncbi:MAG: FixH family protein [Proteobacteria bacterium]|nr:FixH family protein [Pseudomonadota bacterium]